MGVVEPGALGHFSLLFHHRQSLHSYPVLTMMVVMIMTMVLVTVLMMIMVIMVTVVISFFSTLPSPGNLNSYPVLMMIKMTSS